MRARLLSFVLALAAVLSVVPAASAGVFEPHAAASATNGIVYGADGNVWAVEQFNDSVARFAPDGTLLARYAVGDDPTGLSTGPNGSVWVAVTGARRLVWFDALAASPSAHPIDTTGVSGCGPVAITDGGNGKMYFSTPNVGAGACPDVNRLGVVSADGSGAPAPFGSAAPLSFSLLAYQGKVYAPDYDGGKVLRLSSTGTLESTVTTPSPNPNGIAVDAAGFVWVADGGAGGVARFPAVQNSGAAQVVPMNGTSVGDAFGIVAGSDGTVYVAGKTTGVVVRFAPDLSTRVFTLPSGAQPFVLSRGPAGSIYVSNQAQATYFRLRNAAPVISGSSLLASTAEFDAAVNRGDITETVYGVVDPGGNDTSTFADFGTTTEYGQSVSFGPSLDPGSPPNSSVIGTLRGLAAGTLYHVRVRATNAEGTVYGPDLTFTTYTRPPAPVIPIPIPQPRVSLTSTSFKAKGKNAGTTLTAVLPNPAKITARVSLQTKGVKKTRKGKTTCVAAPKKKTKGQKSCTRLVSKGTLNFGVLNAGTSTVAFPGKTLLAKLAPGRYTAVFNVGHDVTTTITFTVKR